MLSDTSVSPLTVTPSPDMVALKLQQVAAKSVPTSGGSRLLRKAKEQRNNGDRGRPVGSDSANVSYKLIFPKVTHMVINRGALQISVYINRKKTMEEREKKGLTLQWQKHPLQPSPPPVMTLLHLVTRSWQLIVKSPRLKPA